MLKYQINSQYVFIAKEALSNIKKFRIIFKAFYSSKHFIFPVK